MNEWENKIICGDNLEILSYYVFEKCKIWISSWT